mmetsp:Transcript_55573/g.146614  ORF Transcript_55573/g.146614 Transcript_55573/m.146614 type:complete len:202 (+) Transcript_55573:1966-2571(+)
MKSPSTSSIEVNCEKTSALRPSLRSLDSSLSRTIILPEAWTMVSSVHSLLASASSKRKGWLHTLRSCITSELRRRYVSAWPAMRPDVSDVSMREYQKRCISDKGTRILISRLGGICIASTTSFLSLRSISGCSSACAATSRLSSPPTSSSSATSATSPSSSVPSTAAPSSMAPPAAPAASSFLTSVRHSLSKASERASTSG